MFCKNCGAQLNENQNFCPRCGAPVQPDGGWSGDDSAQPYGQAQDVHQQNSNPDGYQQNNDAAGYQQNSYNSGYQQTVYNGYPQEGQPPKKSSGKPAIFIIIGIVVLIAVVAGVILGVRSCSGGGGRTAAAVVDNLMEGLEERDADKIMAVFSDGTIDLLEEETGLKESAIALMLESRFWSAQMEYGDYRIDYEITDETDLSDDDIAYIQEEFDDQGVDEKIQDAKSLEIEATLNTDEESEDISMELRVIKIDGKWYVDPTSM